MKLNQIWSIIIDTNLHLGAHTNERAYIQSNLGWIWLWKYKLWAGIQLHNYRHFELNKAFGEKLTLNMAFKVLLSIYLRFYALRHYKIMQSISRGSIPDTSKKFLNDISFIWGNEPNGEQQVQEEQQLK